MSFWKFFESKSSWMNKFEWDFEGEDWWKFFFFFFLPFFLKKSFLLILMSFATFLNSLTPLLLGLFKVLTFTALILYEALRLKCIGAFILLKQTTRLISYLFSSPPGGDLGGLKQSLNSRSNAFNPNSPSYNPTTMLSGKGRALSGTSARMSHNGASMANLALRKGSGK